MEIKLLETAWPLHIGTWEGKHWQRKLIEAEAVTMQYCPHIFIVSEANMLNSLTPLEKNIPGYKLYLPKTSQSQIISRLVIFVKEGINVEVKNELMDDEVSAIWLKCGSRGRRPLLIAGIYREHKFLFQGAETGSDRAQQQRWSKFVDKWKVAAAVANHDVYVIGDTNLDFASWDNPDIAHQRVIEKVKLEVEMSGFPTTCPGKWLEVGQASRTLCWTKSGWITLRRLSLCKISWGLSLTIISFW